MTRARIAFLSAALLSGWACPVPARTYLVAVGISDYPGTVNDLRLPASDARTMEWLYARNDPSAVCKLLLDRQATVANILGAIRETFSKAAPDDIVVFFFRATAVPDVSLRTTGR